MANNISLGIVIGAALSGTVGRAFQSLDAKAVGLGKSLHNVRLGRAASDDVMLYRTKLANLTAAQHQFGSSNANLVGQIARAELALGKASDKARKYGIDVGSIVGENRKLMLSEQSLVKQLERTNAHRAAGDRLSSLKGAAVAAVGVAYSLAQPIGEAISYQHELRMFGNITNLNNQQLRQTRTELRSISKETNQKPGALLEGLGTLESKGLDHTRATASLSIISKTATATGAAVNDLSTTSYSLIDAMGVSPDELPKAMDMLAQSGKEGSFELRDMAQYFPMLTAKAKQLHMTGMDGIATLGAGLQIAMKGAADPSVAANNFNNFLSKLTSPEAVKNFEKMGVDIEATMSKAQQAGLDPVVEMINKIKEMTGGDAFKMGELFGDQQVKDFLIPMMANMEEFNRIKEKTLSASGVVDKDFQNMMGTAQEELGAVSLSISRIGDAFATTLLPGLNVVLKPIAAVAEGLGWLVTNVPGVSWAVGGLAAGFVTYGAALGIATVAQWASTSATVASTNAKIGQIAAVVWQNGVMLATVVATNAVTAAQWLWNAAIVANPIGAMVAVAVVAVAALGAAVYYIYNNWSGITTWFSNVFTSIGVGVTTVGSAIGGAFFAAASSVRAVWEPVMSWLAEKFAWIGRSVEWVKGIGSAIGGAVSSVASNISQQAKGPVLGAAMAATVAAPALATPLPTMPPTAESTGQGSILGGKDQQGIRGGMGDFAQKSRGPVIGAAMAATVAAPALATPLPTMPPVASSSPQAAGVGMQHSVSQNNVFHITQQPGEDSNALAERVAKHLKRQQAADARGALHD